MKLQVQSSIPTMPPLDRNADLDQRIYPDGTMWQVSGVVTDDADTVIGQAVFLAAADTTYTVGQVYTLAVS